MINAMPLAHCDKHKRFTLSCEDCEDRDLASYQDGNDERESAWARPEDFFTPDKDF